LADGHDASIPLDGEVVELTSAPRAREGGARRAGRAEARVDRAVRVVADDSEAELQAWTLELAADEDLAVGLQSDRVRQWKDAEVVRDPATRAE